MTPELLRDVEALCDAVAMGLPSDKDQCCVGCGEHIYAKHLDKCIVMLARRIRERMKADG